MTERTRTILFTLWLALPATLLILFLVRTPVASWYIGTKVRAINREYPATLSIDKVQVRGVASVLVTGIALKPHRGDTLLTVDSAYASAGILKLISGRLVLQDLRLVRLRVSVQDSGTVNNYGFLLKNRSTSPDTASGPVNYATAAGRLLRFVFDKIPRSLDVQSLHYSYTDTLRRIRIRSERISIEDKRFRTLLESEEGGERTSWRLEGHIDNSLRQASFRLRPDGGNKNLMPWLRNQWGAAVSFDSVSLGMEERNSGADRVTIGGSVAWFGLTVGHPRLAAVPVTFDSLGIGYVVNIGRDYAELDSASRITFNRISFHPWIRVRPKPSWRIDCSVHKPPFPAQDLFSSFPDGMFINLEGLKVKNNLSFHLHFSVDLACPDSLSFSTSLDRHKFAVESYGTADLFRLNEDFTYTAWEGDVPACTFTVGPENPDFRPLARISKYLQYAVMTSEDGAFYQHRGFLEDAFRESVVTNIKERRFARGGSTLSMQLVKNVFLRRNKTVARKLEEALLVWLLENQGISTKDRMYEVYLNIIEWGPKVYGANQGARFYFGKDVSRLTLPEAVFMASVIPRPKGFRWMFDPDGRLRPSQLEFYSLVTGKMVRKGWITQEEADRSNGEVTLKGPARLMLKSADSLPVTEREE